MIFMIDSENNITALDSAPAVQDGLILFASEKELAKATAEWPISRLVETWNSFAGIAPFGDLKPVKKFENRGIATKRIWAAIQKLVAPKVATATAATSAQTDSVPAPAKVTVRAGRKPKSARPRAPKRATASGQQKAPREGTAKAKVIAMLERKGGATLQQIRDATGWQPHTVRGFISILGKKSGMEITSSRREDGARVYAVAQ